jgi:pilus assembly protein Flp/PilA
MRGIRDFIEDESGATAIEYGLIAALIAVGIIAAATML